MNFSIDKENNRINVEREYNAPSSKVWDAWTKPELTDQWWAPKPWKAETKEMELKNGGHWLYSMNGPEGEKHWSRFDFTDVQPGKSFAGTDAFTDGEGNVIEDMPTAEWTTTFADDGGKTKVNVQLQFKNAADMNKLLDMGFKEGFESGLGNLGTLLAGS